MTTTRPRSRTRKAQDGASAPKPPRSPRPPREATAFDRKTEKEWQAEIVAAVRKMYGNRALVCHFSDSRKEFKGKLVGDALAKGWFDLVIWLPPTENYPCPRLLFWECKKENGKVTPEQEAWIKALSAEGDTPMIGSAVVRPSDKEEVWQWLKP